MIHKNQKLYFVFHIISGIDIESLIYDLSFGVRLPAPKFCPQSISYLLKKCFVTEPDQRLNFRIMKVFLEDAYRLLFNKKQSAETVQYTTVEILPKSKNQYSSFSNEEHTKEENEPKD